MIDRATVINTLENGLEKFEAIDMETMVSALAWLKASDSKWISVADRLPKDSTRVLVANRSGVNVAWYNGRYWERGASNKHMPLTTVTHWMPLPEPPENGR